MSEIYQVKIFSKNILSRICERMRNTSHRMLPEGSHNVVLWLLSNAQLLCIHPFGVSCMIHQRWGTLGSVRLNWCVILLSVMASDSVVYTLDDAVDSEIQRPWVAAVTAAAVNINSVNGSAPGTKLHDSGDAHCTHGALLGPLGLFVQALLAFIAFTSLIGKLIPLFCLKHYFCLNKFSCQRPMIVILYTLDYRNQDQRHLFILSMWTAE